MHAVLTLVFLFEEISVELQTDFLGAFAKLRKGTVSFVMSVCLSVCLSALNNSALTGRIFMKFDIRVFFENLSKKLKFHQNMARVKGTLHEELRTFMAISR
jgi:hypothetical protein